MGFYLPASIEKGKTLHFYSYVASTPTYAFFDIVRVSTNIRVVKNVALNSASHVPTIGGVWRRGELDTSAYAALAIGETYVVVAHEYDWENDPLHENDPGLQEVSAAFFVSAPMDARSDAILDRQAWLRNDVENVLFPRTRRILGLLGENFAIDRIVADSAGRITAFRLRLFDSLTDAENCTPDIVDGALPEPGEIADYQVTQAWSSAGVRTSHVSLIFTSSEDEVVSDSNQVSDAVGAPGNATWPEP